MRTAFRMALAAVCACVAVLTAAGCKSKTGPSDTATLTVKVDGASCSGKTANIVVSIDSSVVGTIQPGDSGTTKTVTVGDHTVSAEGTNGVFWSSRTISVQSNGAVDTLTCS